MTRKRTTVVAEKDGTDYKLFKVWFGRDGTYYVTVPYHPARTATLWKRTVRYDTPFGQEVCSTNKDLVDVAVLDDDERRVKLSHHPDGLCQFSGEGIASGKDSHGLIRGIGGFTRALRAIGPEFGPVFIVAVYGIESFEECPEVGRDDVLFRIAELAPAVPSAPLPAEGTREPASSHPERESLVIEGFYHPPEFRRFIRCHPNGSMSILRMHPTGIVIPLTVVAAPDDCHLPGFLGMYACRQTVRYESHSGFSINGPGENLRQDPYGRPVGDIIACIHPRLSFAEGRDLRYGPET